MNFQLILELKLFSILLLNANFLPNNFNGVELRDSVFCLKNALVKQFSSKSFVFFSIFVFIEVIVEAIEKILKNTNKIPTL